MHMTNSVRIALVGFGSMGRQYARMIYSGMADGMELRGVCCRNDAGREILNKEYPGVAVYESTDDMAAHSDDFDAVLIVTPHTSHVGIGMQMAQLGKHLLIDKPAGVDAGEVEELVRFCRRHGVAFGMMFNNRMLPAFQRAYDYVKSGKLGALHRAVWVCNNWYRSPAYHRGGIWRSSWNGECGGLLINQNQHYLDIWQWLFGMPQHLYAAMEFGRYNDFSVDDAVDIQFSHDNGFHGTMISATGEAPGINRLEIWGERGKLTVENGMEVCFDENQVSTKVFARTNEESFGMIPHTLHRLDVPLPTNPYQLVLENFVRHLRCGEPLCADGMDGLKTVQLTNAAYVSGWEKCSVCLPVEQQRFRQGLLKRQEAERNNR